MQFFERRGHICIPVYKMHLLRNTKMFQIRPRIHCYARRDATQGDSRATSADVDRALVVLILQWRNCF